MNPLFRIDFSISDSLKIVRKSLLIYETIIHTPMLKIMLGTGCRCGELIGLTWSDVDMEKREIHIANQLIYKNYGDGYKFHVSRPKTEAGKRIIPMSETVYDAFKMQKRLNFMQGIKRTYTIEDKTDFIFMSKNGRPLMPSAINNVLYNIVTAYNKKEEIAAQQENRVATFLPPISAHTMRHTACTRMAEQKIDMKVVQYIMGHSNVGITLDIYTHITEQEHLEKEIIKLDQIKF